MSKYLLSRKMVDLAIIEWERLFDKKKNTNSLAMFIRNKQAIYMADKLIEDGLISRNLNELKKELED